MIYRKQLIKELTFGAFGIFFILLFILVSTQVINLLGRAAGGRVALDAVGTLLVVWVMNLTPLLLILTAFISILTVMTRYWRDSEMAVWLSCGLPLYRWIAPLMLFVLPFVVLTAAVSLWVSPWAQARGADFALILKQRQDMSLVEEGVFRRRGENQVYFAEKFDAAGGEVRRLFVRDKDETGKDVVVLVQEGTLAEEENTRVLNLKNGVRYTGQAGSADFERLGFDAAQFVLAAVPQPDRAEIGRKTATMRELYASSDPKWQAEFMWRLSMPLTIPVLALLALALSYQNPRSGRTYNVLSAVAGFFIYQNLLNLIHAQIVRENISMWAGLFPVHILMLAAACLLLHYRSRPAGFRRKKAAAA